MPDMFDHRSQEGYLQHRSSSPCLPGSLSWAQVSMKEKNQSGGQGDVGARGGCRAKSHQRRRTRRLKDENPRSRGFEKDLLSMLSDCIPPKNIENRDKEDSFSRTRAPHRETRHGCGTSPKPLGFCVLRHRYDALLTLVIVFKMVSGGSMLGS